MDYLSRENERSWAIELISEINIMLSSLNLRIKRAGGERTISKRKKSMFPDLLLYGDKERTKVLQGWELKMPDVLITDEAFINDAKRKAETLGLNSFIIWNFTYGKLYVKDSDEDFIEFKTWDTSSCINTRDDVDNYRGDWLSVIKTMILEVNGFIINGKISSVPLVNALSDNLIVNILIKNKEHVASNYRLIASKNMILERKMKLWWEDFKNEYMNDEQDSYSAYAKTVILNWINRIMFANIIKKHHNCAHQVEMIDDTITPENGNKIFSNIIDEGNYFNVFQGIEFNDYIPEDTWVDITDFNQFLISNPIGEINQSMIQELLEKTVSVSKREVRGQYSTPTWLADLLCQVTVNDWSDNVADVCSGTGTIAKALINNKNKRLDSIEKSLNTTWISDKYAYPLQISNLALTGIDSINIPINLFQSDVFDLNVEKSLMIKSPIDSHTIELAYPKLGAIVSNLPFVKANKINKEEKVIIKELCDKVKKDTSITLTEKSDLYTFIPFKLYDLLKDNGRLGIILSNSWLGTSAGAKFFNSLSYYYDILRILISGEGRWFKNADVVTSLVVLEKKTEIGINLNHKMNLCLSQNDLSVLNHEEKEQVITDLVLCEERHSNLIKINGYTMNDIINIQKIGIGLNAFFHNILWIKELEKKLIPITKLFSIKRGERRGWNDLFYFKKNHDIEDNYIKDVLRKPGNLRSYTATTDYKAFCCNKSIEELDALGHLGAIKWIKKFENLKNNTGKPLPKALHRKGNYWYEMSQSEKANLVTAINPDQRLFIAKFDEATFVDQRFITFRIKDDDIPLELLHALLNSIYSIFAIEANGFGRGLGALDLSATTFKNISLLNPKLLTKEAGEKIVELFKPLLKRDVYNFENELKCSDRTKFDKFVLKSFGIDDYYDDIVNSIISIQKTRLSIK